MKVRLKIQHNAELLENGSVRVGGIQFGIASLIEGPHASLAWDVISTLNNFKDRSTVLQEQDPTTSAEFVDQILDILYAGGHLEEELPDVLTPTDKERYSRSLNYYSWVDQAGESPQVLQSRLMGKSICVIGAGGIGSHVAMMLAAAGVRKLTLVDSDYVELSNLNRQIYFHEDDIGKAKVIALSESIHRLNHEVDIVTCETRIKSSNDINQVVQSSDFLVLAADEPLEIDEWASAACYELGTPFAYARYAGPMVVLGIFDPKLPHGCIQCLKKKELQVLSKETIYNTRPHAVIASSAGLTANLVTNEIIHYLTMEKSSVLGKMFHLNLMDLSHQYEIPAISESSCQYCGISDVRK